jgi:hypothetical protein
MACGDEAGKEIGGDAVLIEDKSFKWPMGKQSLFDLGVARVEEFCKANDISVPAINNTPKDKWVVGTCAYYRPDTDAMRKWTTPGISICTPLCSSPCTEGAARNWSWPGSVTDREPYGVLAHELGHHCDWLTGERKGTYFSDYCEAVKKESGEKGITSYADENPAEWFAEAFRLFVTNYGLLKALRPKTYRIFSKKWKPVGTANWREVLGGNVPPKVLRTLKNKGA